MTTQKKPQRLFVWPWNAVVSLMLILFIPVSHFLCVYSEEGKNDIDKVVNEGGENAVITAGQLCNNDQCEAALLFHGGINDDSMTRLKKALDSKQMKWVCLESPGGETSAAREMAREIRSRQLGTCVAKRKNSETAWEAAVCGSACATVWMGGQKRVLGGDDAIVGLHNPYIGASTCCAVDNKLTSIKERGFMLWEGRTLGDKEARKVLWQKGSQCRPNELYAMRSQEATSLGLVEEKHGTTAWYWKPNDYTLSLEPLVQADSCDPKN